MESPGTNLLAEKIQSPELYKMAAEGRSGKASVLIVLDLPAQQVQVDAAAHRRGERGYRQIVDETPQQQRAARDTVEQAGAFLKKTLGETPHWLRAARAFVADATPEQLRILAGSPLVKAIRLNRRIDPGT